MNINWYPGHMKKTRESIQKNLKMIDIVFELLDARIPYSSQNPVIESLVGGKPRIILLNKSDLADANANLQWQDHYKNLGISSILLNSLSGKGVDDLVTEARRVMDEKRVNNARKGIINQPIRAMILGIPNVGKSTLINSLAGRRSAKTGNRPGITKTNQWIKTKGGIELLDTPGILWPKFEDEQVGINLAFTGAIKDEILDTETLALKLVEKLMIVKSQALIDRYNIEMSKDCEPLEAMEAIAAKRGCLLKGGTFDYEKVSRIILDEFRRGMMGKITLEYPKRGE